MDFDRDPRGPVVFRRANFDDLTVICENDVGERV